MNQADEDRITIEPERVEAIARGEDSFTPIETAVTLPYVNRLLRVSVLVMSIVTVLAVAALLGAAPNPASLSTPDWPS